MLRIALLTMIADASSIWGSNSAPTWNFLSKAEIWGAPRQQDGWFCEPSRGPLCRGCPLSEPDGLPFY